MRRQSCEPSIVYDYEACCFRRVEPPAPRELRAEDRPAVARESVSKLLAQSFGRTLRAGVTVPAHLRQYVRKKT